MRKIDHIGILVKNLDEAVCFAQEVLGFNLVDRKILPSQEVTMACFDVAGQRIELMEPLNKKGSLARFLKDKKGKLHHIAIQVEHFESTIKLLKSKGCSIIGFSSNDSYSGSKITFLHPKDGWDILWEFVEKKEV